jgi:hypothetical protein
MEEKSFFPLFLLFVFCPSLSLLYVPHTMIQNTPLSWPSIVPQKEQKTRCFGNSEPVAKWPQITLPSQPFLACVWAWVRWSNILLTPINIILVTNIRKVEMKEKQNLFCTHFSLTRNIFCSKKKLTFPLTINPTSLSLSHLSQWPFLF